MSDKMGDDEKNREKDRLRDLLTVVTQAIEKSIAEDTTVLEALLDLRNAGFDASCEVEVRFAIERRKGEESAAQHQPLVQDDGSITAETFSTKDVELLRKLKITLE